MHFQPGRTENPPGGLCRPQRLGLDVPGLMNSETAAIKVDRECSP